MRWLNFASQKAPAACESGPAASKGILLQWHLTERCNLRCSHCYQEAHGGKELDFSQWMQILEQFKDLLRSLGPAGRPRRGHITVTGGEPFVRRDFLDLLRVFADNRRWFSFAILSNGSFIDAAMARTLSALGPSFVQISVEGKPATHDAIRGAGTHRQAISALTHLVKHGVTTLISFTAHRGNYREFSEVARLGRRLGVSRVWSDRLIPSGAGTDLRMMTRDETREFAETLAAERETAARSWFGRTEISAHRALQFLTAGGEPYHCTAGDTLLTLQPDGTVYPCRRMPAPVGNVLLTPLAVLYRDSPLLNALRDKDRVSEGCQGCFYSKLCRGGLKCLSYAVTGDPFRADPGCWHDPAKDYTAAPATHSDPPTPLTLPVALPAGGSHV